MRSFLRAYWLLPTLLATHAPVPCQADEANAFAGKTIRILIGFGAGGSYDLYARALARHIGKHLPGGPTVVPESLPDAGSMVAANYIYSVAPKDGTVFGTIASGAPTSPFFYPVQARYDAGKMSWIGSAAKAIHVDIVTSKTPVHDADDLRHREVILGATGPGAAVYDLPTLMNAIAGFKYKLVIGYKTVPDMILGMERGELEGVSGTTWETTRIQPDYLDGRTRIVMQYGYEKVPELSGVTRAFDLARNEDERLAMNLFLSRQEMGKPFVAPPGLAPERLATLRRAFAETMNDPEYLEDLKKLRLDSTPVLGDALQKLVENTVNTPPGIVDRVRHILQAKP